MWYRRKRLLMTLCTVLLSLFWGLSAPAAVSLIPVPIGSLSELQRWYADPSSEMCRLSKEIVIDRSVVLGPTDWHRDIGTMDFKIRITGTGRLVLNNKYVSVMGPIMGLQGISIVVEPGGVLELNQGALYNAKGTTAVLIQKDGILKLSDEFELNGSIIVQEGIELPPQEEETTAPALPPDESESPEEKPTEPPGPTEPSQPDVSSSPIRNLAARVVSIDSRGLVMMQLIFSTIPKDATALYLYRSTDGETFTKGKWQTGFSEGYVWKEDFLLNLAFSEDSQVQNLAYREDSKWSELWLKLEVVGSSMQGESNVVKLSRQVGSQSDEDTDWEEDGSMDGNRGGGGQGESSRVMGSGMPQDNQLDDQDYAEQEAGGVSGNRPRHKRRSEPEVKDIDITVTGMKAGLEKGERESTRETKKQTTKETTAGTTVEEAVEASDASPVAAPVNADNMVPPTDEDELTAADQKSMDRIGFAVIATLLVIGGLTFRFARKRK